mmetsp:Transcript_27482/g.55296  ORF Transcript_27482/g.55296 Transcript_27482/m.55296 type:complete len:263 (+) Transcript_27482:127-915(+)
MVAFICASRPERELLGSSNFQRKKKQQHLFTARQGEETTGYSPCYSLGLSLLELESAGLFRLGRGGAGNRCGCRRAGSISPSSPGKAFMAASMSRCKSVHLDGKVASTNRPPLPLLPLPLLPAEVAATAAAAAVDPSLLWPPLLCFCSLSLPPPRARWCCSRRSSQAFKITSRHSPASIRPCWHAFNAAPTYVLKYTTGLPLMYESLGTVGSGPELTTCRKTARTRFEESVSVSMRIPHSLSSSPVSPTNTYPSGSETPRSA